MYKYFLSKLNENRKYEIISQDRICSFFSTEILNTCNNSNYDFETTSNIKYEVKADHMSLKTGNFYIEINGYNKASGLSTSKANFYIITDTVNYYLIDINILKALVINKPLRYTRDGKTFGHIINTQTIIKHSIII